MQGDNPAQVSWQDQETVKTRSYTVPAGSRLVSTSNQVVVVSAPMPVIEHEETRAKTELGAAQKDTARELSAKLASLKGIVWVGVALFLFGLLVSAGKLRALGKPRPNAVKFFSSVELIALLADPDWLDDATKTIGQFWRRKNARRQGLTNENQADDAVAKDSVVS